MVARGLLVEAELEVAFGAGVGCGVLVSECCLGWQNFGGIWDEVKREGF